MSPKRKLATAQSKHDNDNNSDSDGDGDMPTWNDEPEDFANWHNKLPEYLTDYDDSFLPL